jgi:glycosyltransferase involved in cell wall biosynthesis
MKYDVTIGIPAYKSVDYIEKTMESALSQTFANIEYLVVDDCGNDGTIEVVKRFQREHQRGRHIHIIYNDQNLGVGKARNIIIEHAQGDFLYFMDSDDIIEPETITILMRAIQKYQADAVYASYEKIDTMHDHATELYQHTMQCFNAPDEFPAYVFSQYRTFQVSVCNCLMRIELLRRSGLKFIDTMYWEDVAFTYDMATKVQKVVLLPDITYHYICRPYSLSHYHDRESLQRNEVLNNVTTIDYLKSQCIKLRSKTYAPNLCRALQMFSFYIVCYVLKYQKRITPAITYGEMRQIMRYPLRFFDILRFCQMRMHNIVLWLLPHLPVPLFILTVRLMGKIKRVI